MQLRKMVRHITVTEPLFKLGMTLGEGLVWDTRTQRLYFVDIDQKKVYTYEPRSGVLGYEVFEGRISCLALTESGDGLVGTDDTGFVHIPATSLPFPPTSSHVPQPLIRLGSPTPLSPSEKRFNDGAVDPSGRFLAGTMGREHSDVVGRMYALEKTATDTIVKLVLDQITCTNGMGWTADGTKMYFTDSWTKEIAQFDYSSSGELSNRRTFSLLEDDAYGEPDGLCMDSDGGAWSARWESGKVLRFNPEGKITDEIDFPTAWNITCVVFGGDDLDELYVTTALTEYNGDFSKRERCDGGALFVVKNLGYSGVERHRFNDV